MNYRVAILKESPLPKAEPYYHLVRRIFKSFTSAEEYTQGVSPSRKPLILLEVVRLPSKLPVTAAQNRSIIVPTPKK